MKKTIFAGLTVLEPGESLSSDSGAFTGRDRETIDRLLHIGAKTHRHNGSNGLINPDAGPGVTVLASAGTIPAELAISIGFTLEDADGGETMLSNATVVSTQPPLNSPQAAPSGVFDKTKGTLSVDTYFYAVSWTDGEGGETPLGPATSVERPPGFEKGAIQLSHLNFGAEAAGAKGWNLYRATGGGTYNLLASGELGDSEFLDNGSVGVNCDVHPPAGELNTTIGVNTLIVTLPAGGVLASAAFINLYGAITGDFGGSSFMGQYPVASGGAKVFFHSLSFSPLSPPAVNLSIGGAHQIDPETEILDWHWKKTVGISSALPATAEEQDVRVVYDTKEPWFYTGTDWVPLAVASTRLEGMGVILFGEDLTTPRGTHFKQYTWIGKAGESKPEHMTEFDVLINLP